MEGTSKVRRFARDLHDGPIQDVFATMMRLTTLANAAPDELRDDIRQLAELQSRIIASMRDICRGNEIYGAMLRSPSTVLDQVIRGASIALGFEPRVDIDSLIDGLSGREFLRDLACVLRECLSNIARHANATRVSVEISIDEALQSLSLRIEDDGIGINPHVVRGNGLANIRDRARRNGGSCSFTTRRGCGTTVEWIVPTSSAPHIDRQYGSTGGPEGSDFFNRVAAV